MNVDLDTRWTQAEFGKLIGVGNAAVAKYVQSGVIDKNGTAREWLLQYCASMRESASGRSTEAGGENLTLERALQVKVARQRDELRLEVDRRSFASVDVLERALIVVCAQVATGLQSLHLTLRRHNAALTDADEVVIQREVARAMEACERAGLELADPGEPDEEPETAKETE